MNLTKLAIERPILILMVMVAAILAGMVGYSSMRVEENPDVQFGVITVSTIYPGAGPDEINSLITKKIEDTVSGLNGIQDIFGNSLEGVSAVQIQFKVGADMDTALNEVRSRVDRVLNELPTDAKRPVVERIDTASEPVVTLAISSSSLSKRQLRDLADRILKNRLAQLPGVASVGVSGGDVREIQVQVKRDALLRFGVGIGDIQRSIQNAALNVPGGRVVEGGREYTVRLLGEFNRIEDLANSFITVSDGRGPMGVLKSVRLKDVADVRDAAAERRTISRLNGEEAVIMVIQKAREGNAVEISKALRKPRGSEPSLIDELEKQYGIDIEVSLDVSVRIVESIKDLNFAIIFGIVLVTAVVWLFLHNLRGTIIVAIAIPVCLMATLGAMWALGFTINNLSMLALSLAIGVLVDDAIVIIENIYRHLTMGEDPAEAAINGRAELGQAAIAITLADVVVFLPIGFMGGISGQFFRPLGIGYAVCVLISLLVSFTVTPMLAARWYKKGEDWEHPKGRFSSWFEGRFVALANAYANTLRKALNNRFNVFWTGFVLLVGVIFFIIGSFFTAKPLGEEIGAAIQFSTPVAIIVLTLVVVGQLWSAIRGRLKIGSLVYSLVLVLAIPAFTVGGTVYRLAYKKEDVFKGGFFPPSDTGQVTIKIDLPVGSSLAETQAVADRIEKICLEHPDAEFVTTNIGTRGGGFTSLDAGANLAELTIVLHEKFALLESLEFWAPHTGKLRYVSTEYVAADLYQKIGNIPGVKIKSSQASNFDAGSPVQLFLESDDRALLIDAADKIRERLATGVVPGIYAVDVTSRPGKPEIRAIPNRAKLAEYDLSAGQIGLALRTLYEGDDQAKFRVNGEEYDIRVMMDLNDRDQLDLIKSVPVSFSENKPIFLSDVADVVVSKGLDRIDRRNRLEQVRVTAELLPGYVSGGVQAGIDALLDKENLVPPGVRYEPGGQARVQAQESGYLIGAILTGLVLVYMLLASLYDNLLYPFIIQLAQPQAMVGALLALIITDKTLNVVGFIGIVTLIGLVGKNAILLVDYANTLRKRGMEKADALVESGRTRLRPIMMTTMALLVGTLPVALAIGRGSEFRETIGITIIGGTLLSTMLTLFVIPCSYMIFDDLSERVGKLFRRAS